MERLDRQIQLALKPVGSYRDGEEAGEQQEQRQEKDTRREALVVMAVPSNVIVPSPFSCSTVSV